MLIPAGCGPASFPSFGGVFPFLAAWTLHRRVWYWAPTHTPPPHSAGPRVCQPSQHPAGQRRKPEGQPAQRPAQGRRRPRQRSVRGDGALHARAGRGEGEAWLGPHVAYGGSRGVVPRVVWCGVVWCGVVKVRSACSLCARPLPACLPAGLAAAALVTFAASPRGLLC